MKILFLLTTAIFGLTAYATDFSPRVIYGEDNRIDVYQNTNPLYAELASSTAGMVAKYMFEAKDEEHLGLKYNTTLEKGLNVCPSERFANQPLIANCSGFLVGDDILVSAGHCFKGHAATSCDTHVWVFGLEMNSSDDIDTDMIPKKNIYKCKNIIKAELTRNEDYAIIQLDRKVEGRKPLEYRTSGKIPNNAELVVIGHPSMLPTKIADGGTVLKNNDHFQFTTSLDTFQGNSGSAVFNAQTGVLEGILVSGKTDYIPSVEGDEKSCQVVNHCSQDGRSCKGKDSGSVLVPGENVTRITTVMKNLR
jgi:hypothetical protein